MNRSSRFQATFVAGWLIGFAVPAIVSIPNAAVAAITITVPNLSMPESSSAQSGTFDVYVATTGSSLPEVGDFTVDLQVSPSDGVDFTGGSATTVNPYIFAGQTSGPTVNVSNGGTTIQATDLAGSPPTLVNGDGLLAVNYTVAANISGTFNLTLITTNSPGFPPTALDDQNGNPISFTVQNATLTVVPSTAYWNGGLNTNWNTLSGATYATNWSTTAADGTDTHALPGANTDVFFTTTGGGANLNTTLGAPLSIKGLTFTSAATNPVSISGSTLTIGADGVTIQSGAAAATINSAITLSSNQNWTIAGSNPLTVGGTLSPAGQSLTKLGSGTVRIAAAPSLASGSSLAVGAGTLQFDVTSGAATVGSNVTTTVATAATLQLAGSVSALSDGSAINPADGNLVNITNNGSIASGGGLLATGTNQSVGIVSGQATTTNGTTIYGGDTIVGNGTSGGNLTVTQLLQNTLTIDAGSTLTIRPSGSGSPGVAGGGSESGSAIASNSASAAAAPTPVAPAVASSASSSTASSSIAVNRSAVAAVNPAAASPVAPISDPLLGVQSAIASGNNIVTIPAGAGSAASPVQAAIASIAAAEPAPASSIAVDAPLPNAVASSGAAAVGANATLSTSAVSLGQSTVADADASALISADDNAMLQSQAADSLAFSTDPFAGQAPFGTAVISFGSMNSVPEPSSLVQLLVGCIVIAVGIARFRTAPQ